MKRILFWAIAALCILAAATILWQWQRGRSEVPTSSASAWATKGIELTVYNDNLALVKDRRQVDLRSGRSELNFLEVAEQLDPTSVLFRSVSSPGALAVLEQNYRYDLVDRGRLLQKYLGKEIKLRQSGAGGKTIEGTLLSSDGDELVVQTGDGRVLIGSAANVELPRLPEGLITKPTLNWMVENSGPPQQTLEVSYLTHGIDWTADYVAHLAKDDKSLSLTGWVTVNNRSGATYRDASFKLMAGEVHRALAAGEPMMADGMAKYRMAARPPAFAERPFFGYHIYTLQRRATVRDREQKQITLLTAERIPTAIKYVYDEQQNQEWYGAGEDKGKVAMFVEFRNDRASHLGMPLPQGRVRIYKADDQGMTQFAGEDRIQHTPKNEKLSLQAGNAFDLVAESKRTSYRTMVAGRRTQEEASYLVSLRNHKERDVTIRVVRRNYGDWQVLSASHPYARPSAEELQFEIPVPKDREVKLTYTIRTRY